MNNKNTSSVMLLHELQTPLAICQNRLEMMAESESLTEDQLTEIAKIQQTLTYIIRLNKSFAFPLQNRKRPIPGESGNFV